MAEGGKSVKNLRLEEEQGLSNAVFFGLYTLTQAYKPSAEFQKVFQKDIFLKTNAGALPHVMHYLLTIYDADEFRKRFHWPIYNDREAEKSFRSNCLKYLIELNEKFQLMLEDLSTYMLLFPGGLKFLKVMEKLIKFIITEDMKKKNQLDILESMTIAKGNRIIQKLAEEREGLDKIASNTLEYYGAEQQKIDDTMKEYRGKIALLAAENNVSIEYLFSEEFQCGEEEKIAGKLKKFNGQVEIVKDYNCSVEKLKNQLECVEKPTISDELIAKTQKAIENIFQNLPEIQEKIGNKTLVMENRVNVNFVIRLTNAILPHLTNIIDEEYTRREPTVVEDGDVINGIAREIDDMAKKLEELKPFKKPSAEDYAAAAAKAEYTIETTPKYKFNANRIVDKSSMKLLMFQDDEDEQVSQMQINQLQQHLTHSVRSTKSDASSVFSSMKTTAKKPKKPIVQCDALSIIRATERKRLKSKKTNPYQLNLLSGTWKKEDILSASTVSLNPSHLSKMSIDGDLPLGSSSMIASEREMDDSTFKYTYNPTSAPNRVDLQTSPSGHFTVPSESISVVRKYSIEEDIPEEDNSQNSNTSRRESVSFRELYAKVAAADKEESLFNISDSVLKDVE